MSDEVKMPSVSGPPEPVVHVPPFLRAVVTTLAGLAVAALAFPMVTGMFCGLAGASRSARVQLRNRESLVEEAVRSQDAAKEPEAGDGR